jgi:aminopeptidase N
VRALYFSMAMNNKMLWTDQGINWLTESLIELASINGYVASRLLNTFQQVRNLKPDLQVKVRAALKRIAHEVQDEVSPTVHAQALAYLE